MFIRTERLFLRPGWPEDWAELLDAIDDEAVARNFARNTSPYTMGNAIAAAGQPQDPLLPHFVLTLPTDEGAKLIGSIWLGQVEGKVEIGYWIARDHFGKGYATEAVRAVLSLAPALGHRRIGVAGSTGNPALRCEDNQLMQAA